MKSNLYALNVKDVIRSGILFLITTLITGVYQLIQSSGSLNWDNVKVILMTSIAATISYLVKNYFTNSNDNLLKKE